MREVTLLEGSKPIHVHENFIFITCSNPVPGNDPDSAIMVTGDLVVLTRAVLSFMYKHPELVGIVSGSLNQYVQSLIPKVGK